jgi:HJR/Mrr/RecB family endonuclease
MISEETRQIKEEARARGEVVRVYPLSNDSKLYVFFKDGTPVRSARKSSAWNTLDYYDYETTLRTIAFWQKMGKIPIFSNNPEDNLNDKDENIMDRTRERENIGWIICIGAVFILIWMITNSFWTGAIVTSILHLIFLIFRAWQRNVERKKELKKEMLNILLKKKKSDFEMKQKEKGLEKFIDEVTGEEKWGTPEQVVEWHKISSYLQNNFADFTPSEFEEFIASLFRKMGYETELTSGGGDYGLDVIAKDKDDVIGIQCKLFMVGNNVGAREVQMALGAMWHFKANKAIIVTTSDFTTQAKIQAKESPVELWNKKVLHQMIRKYFLEEAIWESLENSKYVKTITCSKEEGIKKCSISCPRCGELVKDINVPTEEGKELTLVIECKKCGLVGKAKINTEETKSENKKLVV